MKWFDASMALFTAFSLGFGSARLLEATPMPSSAFNVVWFAIGLFSAVALMALALKRDA